MTPLVSDTSPEIERVQIEIFGAMPSWRKWQVLEELILTTRELALAGLRQRFPSAGSQELHRRLATLLLGSDLATKVYGPEPDPPTLP